MNSNSAIKFAVRFALLTGAGAALAVPAAFAQDTSQSGQAASQSSTPVKLGTVTVTGTRIERTSVETAQPVAIITSQEIKNTGLTTIGDVLSNITSGASGINTLVNNGGSGATTIDLRYLGSTRVLVLVNGRRWTPSLGGSVDLNNIPASVIDHIEILQDGASAIYGSDAITGVVNIITVKNFNGAEANAYMGIYHNSYDGFNHWDGKTQSYNFTIGSSGQRGGVVMSAAYTEQDSIWAGSRAQSKEQIWTQGGGSSYSAGGFFQVQGLTPGQADQINSSPNKKGLYTLTLQNKPTSAPSLGNFRSYDGATDAYNFAPQNYFVTPLETRSIYVQGHYDIADNITFTAMAENNTRTSQQQLAPGPLGFGEGAISFFNGASFGVGANNPYNPFHEDLVSNSSKYCPAATMTINGETGADATPCSTPNLLLVNLRRRPIEGGNRVFNQNVTASTIRMGLNGFFNAMGSEWDWDVGSIYGNNYETDISEGGYNTGRVTTALDSPGAAACTGAPLTATELQSFKGKTIAVDGATYPILIAGCVPANFFGGYNQQTSQGSLTPAMINYMQYENHAINSVTMRDYTGNITGNLFDLPAGPFAVAVGLEYLEEDGFDHPDALSAAGNVDETPSQPTNGRQATNSEYVEFNIPLITDVPMFKSLSLDVANRWSQFTWVGGEEGSSQLGVKHGASATTGQAKLRWQTTNDLLLRGSWTQGFRAPSLANLYSGQSTGFPNLRDPCAPSTANGDWRTGTPLPAGCNGIVHVQNDVQIQSTGGGNARLTPERAISKSMGFVYNPSWLPGFDISADYYHIDLVNVVGGLGGQFIMNQCYKNSDAHYCSFITTIAGGTQVTNIDTLSTNTGEDYTAGTDVIAHYRLPATPFGNFSISTNWTFVRSFITVRSSTSSPTGWTTSEQTGWSSIPQKKGNVGINWNYGNWDAVWNIQYIGKAYEDCSGKTVNLNECSEPNATDTRGGTVLQGKNQLGTTIYHDVAVTYHATPIDTSFTFGIRNLFDKQFPAALTAFANSFDPTVGYRVPGRFIYANIGVKF